MYAIRSYYADCDEYTFDVAINDQFEGQNYYVDIVSWPKQGTLYELDDYVITSYSIHYTKLYDF